MLLAGSRIATTTPDLELFDDALWVIPAAEVAVEVREHEPRPRRK
jgi:hypothetical protein